MIRRAFSILLVPVAYAVVAVPLLWPWLTHFCTHILSYDIYAITDASDAFDWVWRYAWFLDHWYRPATFFRGDTIFPPTGENLLFHSHPIISEALTLPVGLWFGPVVATNVMIFALLVGAGCAAYWMLRSAFLAGRFPAFAGGFWFAFGPYFLFRAHKHVNLIGAMFWVSALAIVLHAYLRRRFHPVASIAFALFFWLSFWNSFVEAFMLAIAVGIVVPLFELEALRRDPRNFPRRMLFFLPTLLGAVTLLAFRGGPPLGVVANPLVDTGGLLELFRFPKLGPLAFLGAPENPSGWGTTFSYSALALILIGVVPAKRALKSQFWPLCGAVLLLLALTANVFGIPGTVIRALPMGEGFRIFNRFFPFVVLLLTPFLAFGIAHLLAHGGSRGRTSARRGVLVVLLVVLCVEVYPLHLRIRPVRDLHLTAGVQASLDRTRFCLVVPEENFHYQVHNTYYATLGLPAVNLSYWDKMSAENKAYRTDRYPLVYPKGGDYPARPRVENPGILTELAALNVGYVLFADKSDLGKSVIRGDVVCETGTEILVALKPAAQKPAGNRL